MAVLVLLSLPLWPQVLLGSSSLFSIGLGLNQCPSLKLVLLLFLGLIVVLLGLPHWFVVLLGFHGLTLVLLVLVVLFALGGIWPGASFLHLAIGFFALVKVWIFSL